MCTRVPHIKDSAHSARGPTMETEYHAGTNHVVLG